MSLGKLLSDTMIALNIVKRGEEMKETDARYYKQQALIYDAVAEVDEDKFGKTHPFSSLSLHEQDLLKQYFAIDISLGGEDAHIYAAKLRNQNGRLYQQIVVILNELFEAMHLDKATMSHVLPLPLIEPLSA